MDGRRYLRRRAGGYGLARLMAGGAAALAPLAAATGQAGRALPGWQRLKKAGSYGQE